MIHGKCKVSNMSSAKDLCYSYGALLQGDFKISEEEDGIYIIARDMNVNQYINKFGDTHGWYFWTTQV